MSRAHLDALAAELARRGVTGRARRRVLAEAADHLDGDPGAADRFGDPAQIAQQCADVLGTAAARRASLQAFAALAVAGSLYAATMLAWMASGALRTVASGTHTRFAGIGAASLVVVAPQVSFVAGSLAVLRALRSRGQAPLPAAVVRVLRRRAAVALASGAASIAGVATFAAVFADRLPAWSSRAVPAGAAATAVLLVAGAVPVLRASRLRVAVAGPAGDVGDDLGPLMPAALRGRPWRFAVVVAAAAGGAVLLSGALASDGIDGALRGVTEAAAVLVGFAVLGRYLGLRG
jgi:hypothetical protein